MSRFAMLDKAPSVGTHVGVVHNHRRQWIERKATVTAIINHEPVDGSATTGAIALLSDGTWEFYWNLTELHR